MDEMSIQQEMYRKAVEFVAKRYPAGWGGAVKVAVTTSDNSLKFVTLNELQPYHWTKAFSDIAFFDNKQKN